MPVEVTIARACSAGIDQFNRSLPMIFKLAFFISMKTCERGGLVVKGETSEILFFAYSIMGTM